MHIRYRIQLMKNYMFYKSKGDIEGGFGTDVDIVYVTVAFNKFDYIKYQHELLRKNESRKFIHIIADNSTNNEVCKKIKAYCLDQAGMLYIRLPRLILGGVPKHGACLTYVVRNVISRFYRDKDIVLLDHDIFPIKTILDVFDKELPCYGCRQERIINGEVKWYLWPGYNMIRNNSVCRLEDMDFMNCPGLDTGGRNYERLYRKIDNIGLHMKYAEREYIKLFPDEERKTEFIQENTSELFDGVWLHYIGGAWCGNDRKSTEFYKLIGSLLY